MSGHLSGTVTGCRHSVLEGKPHTLRIAQDGPALGHGGERLGHEITVSSVLDGVGSGFDGEPDTVGSFGMRRYRQSEPVSLLHEGNHFIAPQLRRPDVFACDGEGAG